MLPLSICQNLVDLWIDRLAIPGTATPVVRSMLISLLLDYGSGDDSDFNLADRVINHWQSRGVNVHSLWANFADPSCAPDVLDLRRAKSLHDHKLALIARSATDDEVGSAVLDYSQECLFLLNTAIKRAVPTIWPVAVRITGSFVYGTAHSYSDVDICIYFNSDAEEASILPLLLPRLYHTIKLAGFTLCDAFLAHAFVGTLCPVVNVNQSSAPWFNCHRFDEQFRSIFCSGSASVDVAFASVVRSQLSSDSLFQCFVESIRFHTNALKVNWRPYPNPSASDGLVLRSAESWASSKLLILRPLHSLLSTCLFYHISTTQPSLPPVWTDQQIAAQLSGYLARVGISPALVNRLVGAAVKAIVLTSNSLTWCPDQLPNFEKFSRCVEQLEASLQLPLPFDALRLLSG